MTQGDNTGNDTHEIVDQGAEGEVPGEPFGQSAPAVSDSGEAREPVPPTVYGFCGIFAWYCLIFFMGITLDIPGGKIFMASMPFAALLLLVLYAWETWPKDKKE